MTSPSASELEARMVACAEQALAAAKPAREGKPNAYTFEAEALHAIWIFIQEQIGSRTVMGSPTARLIENLVKTEESRRGVLGGAAVEAARRLAPEAGVEPPAMPEDHCSAVYRLGDRSLAVFLMKQAAQFYAGAAWGSDSGAFRLEDAAVHLLLRDSLFHPPADWLALHAAWQAKRSEGAETYVMDLDTGTVTPERHEGGRI